MVTIAMVTKVSVLSERSALTFYKCSIVLFSVSRVVLKLFANFFCNGIFLSRRQFNPILGPTKLLIRSAKTLKRHVYQSIRAIQARKICSHESSATTSVRRIDNNQGGHALWKSGKHGKLREISGNSCCAQGISTLMCSLLNRTAFLTLECYKL